MDTSTLKHFDYLVEHDSELEAALGLSGLTKSIDHWRRFGMEFPDDALVGCRKTIETALRTLAKPLPDNRMNLQDVIDHAGDKGIINRSMAYKCHEIRKKGNLGAHEMRVKAVDAEMTLDLLDDFLRLYAEDHGLIPAHSGSGALRHGESGGSSGSYSDTDESGPQYHRCLTQRNRKCILRLEPG